MTSGIEQHDGNADLRGVWERAHAQPRPGRVRQGASGARRGVVLGAALGFVLGGAIWAGAGLWRFGEPSAPQASTRGIALEPILDNCTAFAIDRDSGQALAAPCRSATLAILAAAPTDATRR